MSWNNKLVGVGASTVVGGVLGTLVATIFSWLGEDRDENLEFSNADDPAQISDISIRHGYAGPYGPGLLVSIEVQHGKVFRGECAVFVRPRLEKFGIKAKLKDYAAPEDGCILAEGTLEAPAGAKTASTSVYLPYTAFRDDWDRSFTLDVFVVDAAPVEVIAARSVHCEWIPAPPQADLNLMAVLADAAVAMVRRAAPLAREDVRCIREQLTLIFELDKEGLELLRQYLKRADAALHPVSDIAARFSYLIEDESEYRTLPVSQRDNRAIMRLLSSLIVTAPPSVRCQGFAALAVFRAAERSTRRSQRLPCFPGTCGSGTS